ncbi:MAG: hypothetical protein JKY99_01005, partial [Rhizobiales bacterium]|nr:hypothetical protein [Hyphomicrobiales bacterium]
QVSDHELDCAFCYEPTDMKNVSTRPLYSENLCLVGPPSLVGNETSPIDLADIQKLPLILTPRGNGHREVIERAAQKRGVVLEPAIELDLVRLKLEFLMQNDFCTISPFGLFHHEIENGRLKCRTINNPVIPRTMEFVFYRSLNSTTIKRILKPVKKLVKTYIDQPSSRWRQPDQIV